jgi:mannose/fructose/N-acetylgalactosamine-specific phosphotransferase system component IID
MLLGILATLLFRSTGNTYAVVPEPLLGVLFLGVILLCFWMITRGISAMKILYGTVALLLLLSF